MNKYEQKQTEEAVPYVPPPSPNGNQRITTRPPLVNAMIIISIMFLGGFFLYNSIGRTLTLTANETKEPASYISPTPSLSPTPAP